MKLWEVLKALDEGSKSSYKHSSGMSPSIVIYEKYTDGWQEVKQPVTWQEALEAWANGKLIYVVNKAGDRVYSQGGEGGYMTLLPAEILHGTWYIED